MALKDFKQYLIQVQSQYLEMKADIADYEQAFKDGYITEDKLEELKADVDNININYQRLLYVDYLLSIPNRKNKKEKFKKNRSNSALETYFTENNSTSKAVSEENKSLLDDIRRQLKALTKTKK